MAGQLAAGNSYELLSVMPGLKNDTPVGVITVRLIPQFAQLSIMLDRAGLERLVEDVTFILNTSPALSKGNHNEISLAHIEEIAR